MTDHSEPDPEVEQKLRDLMERLSDSTRQIGLYLDHMGIVSKNEGQVAFDSADAFAEKVADGDVMVMGAFVIGEIAWADRTQNPEQHEIDNQAREMLPSEAERIKEKFRRAVEEGRDPFAEDD